MAENNDSKPLKFAGKAGKVVAGTGAMDSNPGILWNNGQVTVFGTQMKDTLIGSEHDDVFFARGNEATTYSEQGEKTSEDIIGKSGYDIAVLPGNREDYLARMPKAWEYPGTGAKIWEGQDHLYGSRLILQDIHTGNEYVLDNVEAVVFDTDGTYSSDTSNRKRMFESFNTEMKNGTLTSHSTQELRAQAEADLSPAERQDAKLASTREAALLFQEKFKFGQSPEERTATFLGIEKQLRESEMDTSIIEPWKPDAPTSDATIATRAPETPTPEIPKL